jgi:threonine/homoserine/homoserine lactone efflux protein
MLILSFIGFGIAAERRGVVPTIGWCVALLNPLTMICGYALYRAFIDQERVAAEYYTFFGWFWLSLLGPFVLVPCVLFGARLARRSASQAGLQKY